MRVGLPRSLTYYYLYPYFKGFLDYLNMEIVLSTPTSRKTLDNTSCCPTDEPCVSIKLFFAHTKELLDKGVDFLFLPILVSLEPENYICPKMIGIESMVRNAFDLKQEFILSPRINSKVASYPYWTNIDELAEKLGRPQKDIKNAVKEGIKRQEQFQKLTLENGLTTVEAYKVIDGFKLEDIERGLNKKVETKTRTAVMGHSYLLYDLVGHRIVDNLRKYGSVITAENVSQQAIKRQLRTVFEGEKLWTFEARILGAALHLMRNRLVDRLVLVGAFECGPESVLESLLETEADRLGIPFLLLSLDEHTGEAGVVTRLEAFMDTSASALREKRKSEVEDKGDKHFLIEANKYVHREKLVVGTPSMGYLDLALRAALQECGVQVVRTPSISRRTVELGKEVAPEFMCFPFVTTLGQMREVLEKGANMILMVGGKGRCRLGWYAQIEKLLLQRLGYQFEMAIIDSPFPLKKNWRNFTKTLKRASGNASYAKIIKGIYYGYKKMAAVDAAEKLVRVERAFEEKRGSADKLFRKLVRRVDQADGVGETKKLFAEFVEELAALKKIDTKPLKVQLVGEIYVLLEPYVNQDIEKLLADREYPRVLVEGDLSATQWFEQHVLRKKSHWKWHEELIEAAKPYLNESVGGHGIESIGLTVKAKEKNADGVVHLLPFTCMPEIVAQNILVSLGEKLDIPIISLVVSEQTGEAGFHTRVEAFLDILEERRWKHISNREVKDCALLYGY